MTDELDELRLSAHAGKVWAQKMVQMWSAAFPLLLLLNPLSQAIRSGDWAPFLIVVGIFAPVFWIIWKFRQVMAMLIEVEEIDFETARLERAERADQLRLRQERRERAEARLARIHQAQRERARNEAVEDLVDLADELGSDTAPPSADT